MRTMRGITWVAGLLVMAACGGSGSDATAPPTSTDLACVNPTVAGDSVACTLTLPSTISGLKVVLTDHQTCEAHGDLFAITAPVADTLTMDGCFDAAGKEIDLTGPYNAGTQITAVLKPGLLFTGVSGLAAVKVSGQYPTWTINMEDASGAFSGVVDDYDDMVITITATAASGG